MLNFIRARILFIALLLALIFLDWKYEVPIWTYALLFLAYLSIVVYGSYFIQSDFFVKSLWKGTDKRKAIAITFDDGPLAIFTPGVLDILKKEQVPAAFFVIGKNIDGNEEILKRIDNEGHLIGNHSYSHTYWFSMNSSNVILEDLKHCDEEILRVTGKKPKFFRPPYGVINPMVRKAILKGNYDSIGWSIRTYDTNAKSKEALLAKSLKNLSNGDVILFHDWGQHTLGILSDFIAEVRTRGFEIVRVDDLFGAKAYY
jgi:peptidoglycan/xylan/chitin deacetylase (PgdA/CDA1 family)